MADVILSEEAKTDLDAIDRFGIQTFGADVATEYMAGFRTMFERVSKFPESGSTVERILPTIRRVSHRSHHIFYKFDGTTVHIVRILHHAMNAKQHLRQ